MKVRVKSWSQLQKEGFKHDYPSCYKGDKKSPDCRMPHHWVNTLCGEEVEIVQVNDYEYGRVTFTHRGHEMSGGVWLFEDTIDLGKIKKPSEKKFPWCDKPVRFYGYFFKFPCDMSEMTLSQAEETAKWILKTVEKNNSKRPSNPASK